MRKNILHKVGAFILAAVMLGGVAALAGSTAQAQRRRVIIAPRVYVGHRRPYYRHWRNHRHYHRW
jgi:hypothetical protein